ncbi:hypothetical protein [Nostoc sp.]|uniref:hypothetical protein n=1 Tax=Nostoc sp. TaxID=1180 RepID=UPI002FF78511
MNKAKRALIQIAGIEIEVFQLPDGTYVMSQSQASKAIGLSEIRFRRFLSEKSSEVSPEEDLSFDKFSISGTGRQIKAIPANIASDFWLSQVSKGNNKAIALVSACMQEALQRRCDTAFGTTKTEHQYEQQTTINREQWETRRKYLREQHTNFEFACKTYGFSCASTHNKLTLAAVHKTAKELKELEIIQGNKDVGLNYIEDSDELQLVANVKKHFSRYRKGDVNERIHRALKDSHKEKR